MNSAYQARQLPLRNIWGGTFAIRAGKDVQEIHGETLVALYREQRSYAAVARALHLTDRYGSCVKESTLAGIVRCALAGNVNARLGPLYAGLLDAPTLALLGTQHHLTDDAEDRKQGRGIYAIPREKKRTQLLQGLRTQGKTLWSPVEIAYLAAHRTDPALHSSRRGLDTQKLAAELNSSCHSSDGIQRTPRQISRALYRFKGSFSLSQ